MRILHVGATGTLGQAVGTALRGRGHDVVPAHRSSADHPVDLTDPASIAALVDSQAEEGLDAIVCTAGVTPFGAWDDLDRDALPGFPAVDGSEVGHAFVRSVESMETGRVYEL